MGQYYCVEVEFGKESDIPAFGLAVCKKLNELAPRVLEKANLNDPFDVFECLAPNAMKWSDLYWSSEFDASYSWEPILLDVCEEAIKALSEGSEIIVYADENSVQLCSHGDGKSYAIEFHDEEEEA